jgi:hypothetical protein
VKIKYCKKCNVELNTENCYSRSAIRFRPLSYCIKCDAKLHRKYYKENQDKIKARSTNRYKNDVNNFPTLRVKRGRDHKSFKVVFKTLTEKRSFVLLRRLQIKYGKCHVSRSAKVNQSVDVKHRDDDGNITYVKMLCSECNSLVRYNKNGFKECTNCGLIQETLEFDNFVNETKRDAPSESEYTDNGCYDAYYSEAYSNKLM